jgi:hypothetical protein
MNKIENLSDYQLLEHFKDAVSDIRYNPSDEDYNQSGFTYVELEIEILKRMSSNNIEDEDVWIS